MDPAPPAESGVRIYRASGAGLVEVARLDAVAPPRAAEGVLAAEIDGNHVGGEGLFLALVQGGTVVELARLVFCGGAPSGADGGPDCYSTDPSSSEDKAPPPRAKRNDRAPPPRSRGDDEVIGALSVCGGLLGFDEGNIWEVEDVPHLTSGEDEDWSSVKPVQSSISSLWRSGNSDSSSEEELDGDDDGNLKMGEDDLSNKILGKYSSSFWTSGIYDSTSDEEEVTQELGHQMHRELSQGELHLEVDENDESEEENETST